MNRKRVNEQVRDIVHDVAVAKDLTQPQQDRLTTMIDQLVCDAVECGRAEYAAELRQLLAEGEKKS